MGMSMNKNGSHSSGRLKNVGLTLITTLILIGVFVLSFHFIKGFLTPSQRLNLDAEINQTYSVLDSEGGTYFGPVVHMEYEGIGEFQYLKAGRYEGEFSESQRSGNGTFIWDNGDSFSGTWLNDDMLEGTYTFSDGAVFKGTFELNRMKEGTLTYADGTSFKGTFSYNRIYTGTFSLGPAMEEKGFTEFEETFTDGVISDIRYQKPDGTSYNGKVSGKATIKYPNGDKFEGTVANGERSDGTYTWLDDSGKTAAKYVGKWENGVMNGKGIYYFSSASYPNLTGTWKNGKPDGSCVYYKETDNKFNTTWVNGRCTAVTED